jgi:hypothetical protein
MPDYFAARNLSRQGKAAKRRVFRPHAYSLMSAAPPRQRCRRHREVQQERMLAVVAPVSLP